MTCSCHEEPELNFIFHSGTPRFIVEVADSFDDEDIRVAREHKLLFRKAKLTNGEEDLLVLVDILEPFDLTIERNYDRIHTVFDELVKWHIKEVCDLESYANQ